MDVGPAHVAVVTGAASGIGAAICQALVDAGCHVVAADVETPALEEVVTGLRERGGDAIGVRTDVADESSVRDLAAAAEAEFGAVHLLFSNAGVTIRRSLLDTTDDDWRWILGVNLWGTVHMLNSFLPVLTRQDKAHVVVTASVAGVLPFTMGGAYNASKAALVALTETLYLELAELAPHVGVTMLVPGPTRSRISDAVRNRPDWTAAATDHETEALDRQRRAANSLNQAGMEPAEVATRILDGVRRGHFYVVPHRDEYGPALRDRIDQVLSGGHPNRVPIEEIFRFEVP